jgi:hypothetical protein
LSIAIPSIRIAINVAAGNTENQLKYLKFADSTVEPQEFLKQAMMGLKILQQKACSG